MLVELEAGPLLSAGAAALACLLVLVVPGTLSARAGLLFQKLSVSRPPSVSWFHRYYVDVAVLVVGGLVFWELHSRGGVVSGGLFGDVGVNEPLLLAPVLFLAAVGLLFVRLFPLLLRYVSGESQGLVHVLAASSASAAAAGIVLREGAGPGGPDQGPAAGSACRLRAGLCLCGAVREQDSIRGRPGVPGGGTRCLLRAGAARRARVGVRGRHRAGGGHPRPRRPSRLFRTLVRRSPVWLAMTLWHMGRNPLQYTWLVLLLVLVTGLGILATTVGGTLTQSRTERILYEVGTDIRVTGQPAVHPRRYAQAGGRLRGRPGDCGGVGIHAHVGQRWASAGGGARAGRRPLPAHGMVPRGLLGPAHGRCAGRAGAGRRTGARRRPVWHRHPRRRRRDRGVGEAAGRDLLRWRSGWCWRTRKAGSRR